MDTPDDSPTTYDELIHDAEDMDSPPSITLVNLTPHAVTIHGTNGAITLQPSGVVARCEVVGTPVHDLCLTTISVPVLRIPVDNVILGDVTNLPDYSAGKMFIVSALVALARKDREDLYSPGELVRDENGVIVGAKGLVSYFRK